MTESFPLTAEKRQQAKKKGQDGEPKKAHATEVQEVQKNPTSLPHEFSNIHVV